MFLACVSGIWVHFGFTCVRDHFLFLLWCDVVCYFFVYESLYEVPQRK